MYLGGTIQRNPRVKTLACESAVSTWQLDEIRPLEGGRTADNLSIVIALLLRRIVDIRPTKTRFWILKLVALAIPIHTFDVKQKLDVGYLS